jgi:hypothetical protein
MSHPDQKEQMKVQWQKLANIDLAINSSSIANVRH